MGMHRFTWLTNGFGKELENRLHMLPIYFVHYYFVRMYKTLPATQATAAGVTDCLHDMALLAGLVEATSLVIDKRKTYQKKVDSRKK